MSAMRQHEICIEAMKFAATADDSSRFLHCWLARNWKGLNQDWPTYEVPFQLVDAVECYADWVRHDRRIVLYAYQYDVDGVGCIAKQPIPHVAPIVIDAPEVSAFLNIVAQDEYLERSLLESCQDGTETCGDAPAVLVTAEAPLCVLRARTFCGQWDETSTESKLSWKIHEASRTWRRHEADYVQIVAYAK